MDDLAVAFCIPLERSVFARIVADRDDEARGVMQAIRGLPGQLANPAAEIVEQMCTDSARGLECADYRELALVRND